MLELSVKSIGIEELSAQLGKHKGDIQTAMRRAAVAFNRELKSSVLSEVRKRIGLSQSDMNKIRIRSAVKRGRLEVSLWVGSNPVDVRYLNPRFVKGGVKVKSETFDRAFMPWKNKGKTVILQRVGKERLPVVKPDVDINDIVLEVIEKKWSHLESYFYKRVERELLLIK